MCRPNTVSVLILGTGDENRDILNGVLKVCVHFLRQTSIQNVENLLHQTLFSNSLLSTLKCTEVPNYYIVPNKVKTKLHLDLTDKVGQRRSRDCRHLEGSSFPNYRTLDEVYRRRSWSRTRRDLWLLLTSTLNREKICSSFGFGVGVVRVWVRSDTLFVFLLGSFYSTGV